MDLTNFFSGFIGFALAVIFYFLFKDVLPSYLKAKATNQATKEDIGEITDIVESIRTDLNQKTEELKAQLSFANQHRLNIKGAEREAFFDYNKKLSSFIYYLTRFGFSAYNWENYTDLGKVNKEADTRQLDLDLAEAHLTLFFRDQEFLELKRDLSVAVIKLEEIISDAVFDLKGLYNEYEIKIKHNPENEFELKKEFYEKRKELNEPFLDKKVEQFGVVHDLHMELVDMIYDRVEKIIEEETAE